MKTDKTAKLAKSYLPVRGRPTDLQTARAIREFVEDFNHVVEVTSYGEGSVAGEDKRLVDMRDKRDLLLAMADWFDGE